MVELSDVTNALPSKQSVLTFGGQAVSAVTIFILVVVVGIILGIIAYVFLNWLKYKHKIIIWEKINNNWEITGKDRAMEIKYGAAGDVVFLLKKRKKYLPRPELQTGRRTYWYAIREDGEWQNITMQDIDFAMKQARVKYLRPEMRYARTSLQRGIKDRYNKEKFMEKYGHIVIPLAGFLMVAIFIWLIFDKFLALSSTINSHAQVQIDNEKALGETVDKVNAMLAAADNLCSKSGVKPVT